jgi:multidrug efflux pump subunit AcrA (membrane-fusion protein)
LTKEKRTAAEVAKDRAYEGVVMAQRNLRNAGIVAPFDGVVVSVTHPYSGVNTTMAERQIELINPESVYFSVNADQTEVVDLKIGQEARIQLDAFSDEELIGEIEYIALAPKIGEVGAVYEVKIRFGEVDVNKFRVGMTGDVFLTRKQVSNVLYVPPRFVNSEKGERFLLLDGGKKVKVEVGVEGEERVEVRGEVKEGDVIYD